MDGEDSEDPIEAAAAGDDPGSSGEPAEADMTAEADRAAESLKGQIAALRRQVRDAQDRLRGHRRRAEEGGAFKR